MQHSSEQGWFFDECIPKTLAEIMGGMGKYYKIWKIWFSFVLCTVLY